MERKLGLRVENLISWNSRHKNMDRRTFRFHPNAKDREIIRTLKDEKLIDAIWGNLENLSPRRLEVLKIRHITQER
ncbi:MAG: hypothetical protein A3B38_01065 [Candidatus Levybacteria bacterium RIFCSPLOWO2_01_FULL_36_13]|nr:MAG: hypothetical protein A2684_02305 [Candidatus Levybacteria bacterium RIFCSPHIGHO2_01_FULL_36_15b]OGH35477.1 MAG: hypothetical protein A3B38_01065 [Candidatus Levybacteria bacterium RIFCSPLOWO2_01_FULL_36_13]